MIVPPRLTPLALDHQGEQLQDIHQLATLPPIHMLQLYRSGLELKIFIIQRILHLPRKEPMNCDVGILGLLPA